MRSFISKSGFAIATFLLVFAVSCKKKDTSFEPIALEGIESQLNGTWNVISARAVGEVKVAGIPFQVEGSNITEPEGVYILTNDDPNLYLYDIKTELRLTALNGLFSQNYSFNDKDAGTWVVSADEKSVVLTANQGVVQQMFFTQYDSAASQYMQIAVPVDTAYSGYDYKGTVFFEMNKIN